MEEEKIEKKARRRLITVVSSGIFIILIALAIVFLNSGIIKPAITGYSVAAKDKNSQQQLSPQSNTTDFPNSKPKANTPNYRDNISINQNVSYNQTYGRYGSSGRGGGPFQGFYIRNLPSYLTLIQGNSYINENTPLLGNLRFSLYKNSIKIADFNLEMNQDFDFSGLSADTDFLNGKAFIHSKISFQDISLFVPRKVGQNQVIICENSSSLYEIQEGCGKNIGIKEYILNLGDNLEFSQNKQFFIIKNISGGAGSITSTTFAQHLDENEDFISDISSEVEIKDNIWGEYIKENESVKLKFDENLSNKNYILIYAKSNSSSKLEVYANNKIISEKSILSEGWYNLDLINLDEKSEFELKVKGSPVQFDYIYYSELNISQSTINIVYPENSFYNEDVSSIYYTLSNISDSDSCWYSKDGGLTNSYSVSAGTNFNSVTSIEGTNNWIVYCNNSYGDISSSSVTFIKDITPPKLSLLSPNDEANNKDTQVLFQYAATDNLEIKSCYLLINNTLIASTNTGQFQEFLDPGVYTWQIRCTDKVGNENLSEIRTITIFNSTEFNGRTTDLTKVDKKRIKNFTLEEINFGYITFKDDIDLSSGANLDKYVKIGKKNISIDSKNLPQLNKPAILAFYNVDAKNPVILRNGKICTDTCKIISFGNGNLVFSVTGFSSYTVGEDSRLEVWDDSDINRTYSTTLKFYANYTAKTDSSPITGAVCNIYFDSSPLLMSYNAASKLYEYTKTFSGSGTYYYNISCDGTSQGFAPLSTDDFGSIQNIVKSVSGAQVREIKTERATPDTPTTKEAFAGNLTQIDISGYSVTQAWQGYFGNVSGTIQLTDASDNVMYNWSAVSPNGEVYSTSAFDINFASIDCANSSQIEKEQLKIGGSSSDVDSIVNTFNQNNHPLFYTGSNEIAKNKCSSTNIFSSSGQDNAAFYEVLLSDPANNILYTSILEQDKEGFNLQNHDFEMIVGENGHGNDTSTTPYYFFLEIS